MPTRIFFVDVILVTLLAAGIDWIWLDLFWSVQAGDRWVITMWADGEWLFHGIYALLTTFCAACGIIAYTLQLFSGTHSEEGQA